MKFIDLKRYLASFIYLLAAFLIFTVGCHVKKTEENETKEPESAESYHVITSPDDLKSVFPSDFTPETIKEFKEMTISTLLPAVSEKNKDKLNEIVKYLDIIEKKPADYFEDINNIIDLTHTIMPLIAIAAESEPDNFYVNRKVPLHYTNAGYMIESLSQSEKHKLLSDEYKKKGAQAAKDLVERFPDKAEAYAQFAFSVIIAEGDKQKAMGLFKRCLELDPKSEYCRKSYDDLLEELNASSPSN